MENLIHLYKIHSPSGEEQNISKHVQKVLKKFKVDYSVDEHGQVYNIIPGTPLISCHMDQVGIQPLEFIYTDDTTITGDKNIGADDKNGVWLCLELLKSRPKGSVSFIFSVEEEIGGKVSSVLEQHSEEVSQCLYGLIFDRKGSGDIIGYDNNYCTQSFENDLSECGELFGFKPAAGIWSDADVIKDYMSCVNLSVGYYNAHTDKEYTLFHELQNSLEFAHYILENITEQYEVPEYIPRTCYGSWKYGNGWDDTDGVIGWQEEAEEERTPICPDCYESLTFDRGSATLYCTGCGYEW